LADILAQIIADKERQVALGRSRRPVEELAARARSMPRCRNFFKAVTGPNARGLNVIAEVKKASPSAGVIRADFDAAAIAAAYESCGAEAVSVLTDENYFRGGIEDLRAVKRAVSLPVLRKDFIIDPWQVYESRVEGADAILLIAEVLKMGLLSDLMILASELTLTVMLEVHTADALLSVRSLIGFPKKGYSVLGINNRDLSTMIVDVNTACRLSELAGEGVPFVAESGIKTRADVEKLIRCGARAVLVGEVLCASDSIEEQFRDLFPG
jgi:indole-3-glycerol phosphate synthase